MTSEPETWLATWLDAVADGRATMSRRARSAIDAHGGVDAAVAAAAARGIHLAELADDGGRRIVVASRHPFRTLC